MIYHGDGPNDARDASFWVGADYVAWDCISSILKNFVIFQTFNLQKQFFLNRVLIYSSIFRMEMWDVKRKKREKESCKSLLFARFDAWCLHHDLSVVYQAQASFGVS